MKNTIVLGLLSLALLANAQSAPVALRFNDPGITYSNLSFNFYWTTNLALPTNQWPLLATVQYNNLIKTNGNQLQFSTNLTPANYFFTATTTNTYWGLSSFFSNGAATPPILSNTFPFNLTLVLP